MVEPARPRDPLGQPSGGLAVGRGLIGVQAAQEGGQQRQLLATLAAGGGRRLEITGRQVCHQPLEPVAQCAEPDDEQARLRHAGEDQRPGGEQQLDALGADQLADEHHQAV